MSFHVLSDKPATLNLDEALRLREGVHPDITHATADTGPGRVEPPGGLFVVGGFLPIRQPALRILHYHFADATQFAGGHPCPRLLDQRITGVGMGQAVQQTCLL